MNNTTQKNLNGKTIADQEMPNFAKIRCFRCGTLIKLVTISPPDYKHRAVRKRQCACHKEWFWEDEMKNAQIWATTEQTKVLCLCAIARGLPL